MEDKETLFLNFKLDPKTVQTIIKNAKVSNRLYELILKTGLQEASKSVGEQLYYMTTKLPEILMDSD